MLSFIVENEKQIVNGRVCRAREEFAVEGCSARDVRLAIAAVLACLYHFGSVNVTSSGLKLNLQKGWVSPIFTCGAMVSAGVLCGLNARPKKVTP